MPTATKAPPSESPNHRTAPGRGRLPERVVLDHLLDQHPRRLTLPQLAEEVGHTLRREEIRQAVANLTAARLVENGRQVVPSEAVVLFDQGQAPVHGET